MAMHGTMVPRTTQPAGPQSFAMGGYMDMGAMGGAQPMDSEGRPGEIRHGEPMELGLSWWALSLAMGGAAA